MTATAQNFKPVEKYCRSADRHRFESQVVRLATSTPVGAPAKVWHPIKDATGADGLLISQHRLCRSLPTGRTVKHQRCRHSVCIVLRHNSSIIFRNHCESSGVCHACQRINCHDLNSQRAVPRHPRSKTATLINQQINCEYLTQRKATQSELRTNLLLAVATSAIIVTTIVASEYFRSL